MAENIIKKPMSLKLIYALLVFTMASWGGTFAAGRLVAAENGPLTVAFWRFGLAALALIPLTIKKEERLIPRGLGSKGWLSLFLLGLTGTSGYNYFFIKGLSMIEAGRASVIVATSPCLTYLGMVLFFGREFSLRGAAGFICALGGAILAISRGDLRILSGGGFGQGELFIFGCVVCWAAYTLIGKIVLERLSPLLATTWATIFAMILLAPAACLESGAAAFIRFSLMDWFCLAFLGLIATSLGFNFYYQGIARLGADRAAIFINLVPIFGILCGWIFLGENLGWYMAVGVLMVLAGIRLTRS